MSLELERKNYSLESLKFMARLREKKSRARVQRAIEDTASRRPIKDRVFIHVTDPVRRGALLEDVKDWQSRNRFPTEERYVGEKITGIVKKAGQSLASLIK